MLTICIQFHLRLMTVRCWLAHWLTLRRKFLALAVMFGVLFAVLFGPVRAAHAASAALQGTDPNALAGQMGADGSLLLPSYWYLLMAALSLLVPAGLILISVAGLEPERAWSAALGGLGAIGITGFSYWAFGFALQFGGVGLIYPLPELRMLVWEWSAFSPDWGIGWGMAGLSGWFLSGADVTPLVYALFLAHLPWAMTAAALPVIALRGRAPATAPLVLAFFMGGVLYPLAGNWVQGGGWLSALGRNINLGHGLIDFGGAGTVHLVAGGFAVAALLIWTPRRARQPLNTVQLPPVQLPLLASVGALLLMAGSMGWWWANPLQTSTLSEVALMRGGVNNILFAGGGALIPLIYTWFVTGRADPLMTARGLAAGVVAGLACGPFVQPGVAFFIGFFAGGAAPFVAFVSDHVWRLDDATGVAHVSMIPAAVGLLLVGLFADGTAGSGWQTTGVDSYLGVTGQGVSGLFVARGYQPDFPAQFQAQVIGVLALALWGFVSGLLICGPVALIYYGLQRSASAGREAADAYAGVSEPEPDLVEEPAPAGHRMNALTRRTGRAISRD
jgi:Amt family ammonium transporter